jgi:phosphoserine phosphatase RsbU/P
MRILLADDDAVLKLAVESALIKQGHQVVAASNGLEAWNALRQDNPPRLAILDWLMPEVYGTEVCRRVRQTPGLAGMYLLLLTVRNSKTHVIEGLQAGANDYVTKPFDPDELLARVGVGVKVLQLQFALEQRVRELEAALGRVNQLHGLIPVCARCQCARNDQSYWHDVETYLHANPDAIRSQGVCPKCRAAPSALPEAGTNFLRLADVPSARRDGHPEARRPD